ncbi:hypothetical protein OG2516_08277 [Oceanicola granulosus HTCC2516]|uniref:4Fe-4S ferredoxin-type domain-containing protein n=1 Tax=Oceanicola granulosus (strain ATCC BAA-861 / DSM 15982 / KCTC 12143 / HTCC2516) TaxID=314256 RepID=Q2CHZ9_OCEGH|nr:hypothetical protein [Oceanicola granulosus]EAR52459.1 hypothetical protein OG2516_08277 [Oceanicola granulosus HTCC2516]
MTLAERLAAAGLFVSGTVEVAPQDGLAPDVRRLLLLSPDEPRFWDIFQTAPEAGDGAPDPLDRWSARVIGGIAEAEGAHAYFPFGGPPWHPFVGWALRSGRSHASPVGLMVHVEAGLFVSWRGALGVAEAPALAPAPSPCPACDKPCLSACPVGAFASGTYDVPRCKGWLGRPEGAACRDGGCLVRRACPVGRERRRPAQSAFHMRAFHGA